MKSKAYVFANAADYDIEDISEEVTFAETAGKAKQDFSISTHANKEEALRQLDYLALTVNSKNK